MAGTDEKAVSGLLSNSEISTFCAQVAMIMKSGISVGEGISIMFEDMKNAEGKEILGVILEHVEMGEPIFMALAATDKFPKYVVSMVEIGEQAGKLDEVLESLCLYYEREEGISKSIKNAVTYPLVMIAMMVLVISVLVVKVLPIFGQVFKQLGSEMSGISVSIMNIGASISKYSVVILGVAIIAVVGFILLKRTAGGRDKLARFNASFFATKKLSAKIASGRFASAMSLMLSSGLDTDQSLDMVTNLVDNAYIREKIKSCKEHINDGASFSDALVKSEIFTGVYARMISVGFKTGSVDTVMKKLADRYEGEVDTQINGMISILEPTLVAILSIIVGMILLSVILPLMGIMSSIG